VIGGYVPGTHGLDSIIVGYYRGNDLVYVARVRNGFVPASRRLVFGLRLFRLAQLTAARLRSTTNRVGEFLFWIAASKRDFWTTAPDLKCRRNGETRSSTSLSMPGAH